MWYFKRKINFKCDNLGHLWLFLPLNYPFIFCVLRRKGILRCWRLSEQTLHPGHEVPMSFHYRLPPACLGFLLPLSTVCCQDPCGTRLFKTNWFWTVKLLVERKSRWAIYWLGLITFIKHIFFILKSTQQANLFVAVLLASLWNVGCSFPTMYWVQGWHWTQYANVNFEKVILNSKNIHTDL